MLGLAYWLDGGRQTLQRNEADPGIAEQANQTLINQLLNGAGLEALVAQLGQRVGRSIFVANLAGRVLAGHPTSALQDQFTKFVAYHANRNEPVSLRHIKLQAAQFDLSLLPLVVEQEIMGLLVTDAGADHQAEAMLVNSVNVMTLALLKFLTTQQMADQQRRDLLEDLLSGDQASARRLTEQAQGIGWELEAKPVVILLEFWQSRAQARTRRALNQTKQRQLSAQFQHIIDQALANHAPESIVAARSHGFVILPHLTVAMPEAWEQAKTLAAHLMKAIEAANVKVGYAIAGGGFHAGLDGLRHSFQEAQQALDVGTRLNMRRPIWFEEIYLYLLLERSGRNAEVQDWVNRTLGPLVEYDRRNKTDLHQTLEVYFDTNQTLQEAAHTLHIHPNTLKYRLGRIEQILGQDPFKGENQLRFYLATKMARLLK